MTYAIDARGRPLDRSSRYLWATVGVLGAATLAMGAALVHMRSQPAALTTSDGVTVPASAAAMPAQQVLELQAATGSVEAAAPASVQTFKPKVPLAPVKPAQAAIRIVAKSSVDATPWNPQAATPQATAVPQGDMADAAESLPASQVIAQAPRLLCAACGTVESVDPIQRDAAASGAGAIAGAVLGGLVGNQFGGGDGKAVATIIGAMGGGWAGNTVEKRMKKEIGYRVQVRMEDGSVRTLEHNSPVAVGTRVTVDGSVISPVDPGGAKIAI